MPDTQKIFSITNTEDFNRVALQVFQYQYEHNKVYRQFCRFLKQAPEQVDAIEKIPFFPIELFKSHTVISSDKTPEIIFSSSGTTGVQTSQHPVIDMEVYKKSFRKGFEQFYGDIQEYTVLALLPSYLERKGSSLIFMVNDLIERSQSKHSGFYLNNLSSLRNKLLELDRAGEKVLLIGVSFALLDLTERFTFNLENTIVMETGGMKGRRKEMIRAELHQHLKQGLGVEKIHSEYGMTELLSQAYSKGDGIFECPPWMKFLVRDPEDPLEIIPRGKTGGLNVIDLANVNSCSFIATQDLGKTFKNGSLEILGRFDNSDIRGCNLLLL